MKVGTNEIVIDEHTRKLVTHGLEQLHHWKKSMKNSYKDEISYVEEFAIKTPGEIEISQINEKLDRLIANINMLAELICKDIK